MGCKRPKYLCKCTKDFSIFMSYIPELAMRMSDAAELATMSRLCQPEPAQLMSSLNQFRQAVAWICFLIFKPRADTCLESVLGICDMWCGSVPLTNESGVGSGRPKNMDPDP
jgi:hypothetical protein